MQLIKPDSETHTKNIMWMTSKNWGSWLSPFRYKPAILMMAFAAFAFIACQDANEPSPVLPKENQQYVKVNEWILENMQFWYLWSDKLPTASDKTNDPEAFFKSLLYKDDRFSWIQDNYTELLNSLQGVSKEAGYEYVLYRESEASNNVVAQILYIKPNSPASQAALKRGDVITKINNQQITTSNYQALLDEIKQNHTVSYKPLNIDSKSFGAESSLSLTTVEYSEDPNYLSKVISDGGHKIGYFVYNFFAAGTKVNAGAYDAKMDNIFADFKAQGVSDLIIDLRFNSGGSESSAANLASLIGAGVNDTKIFAKRAYNEQVQEEILNDPELGESFLNTKFINKVNNIGSQLGGGRVYVLTGSRTASASELVINALKPFMEVFLIGDVTYGKNVGSISLYEENDPDNKWGLQPIVVKVSNSLGQSDYAAGFTPNVLNEDNSLYLYPLGDPRENLLSHAIAQITGTASTGRLRPLEDPREIIRTSLDDKRRSFNLIIDKNIPAVGSAGH
jgi:carboxyl-terminal processing protease